MKVSLLQFLLLSVFLLGNMDAKAQLNNNLTADELRIKQEVKPFLDSLIIEEPKITDKDISLFRLEAVFPAKSFTRFGTNEGEFTAFTPDNPKSQGLVSEPIPCWVVPESALSILL